MLDEQSGALLDALLEKVLLEVQVETGESHQLLLAPLRTLGQLRNVGPEKVDQLISTAVKICLIAPVPTAWKRESKRKEEPYQKVFSALEKLPPMFYSGIVRNLQEGAQRTDEAPDLLPIVVFHYEFSAPLETTLEQIIPSWQAAREDFGRRHLSAFYSHVPHVGTKVSERIEQFVRSFGREKLFLEADLHFRTGSYFIPVTEFSLRKISSERERAPYDLAVSDFLSIDQIDFLLSGLVATSAGGMEFTNPLDIIIEHFSVDWADAQKYLVDWLILVRTLRAQSIHPAIAKRSLKGIRSIMRKGKSVQKFYSALLLGKPLTDPKVNSLQVGPQTQTALLQYSQSLSGGRPSNG